MHLFLTLAHAHAHALALTLALAAHKNVSPPSPLAPCSSTGTAPSGVDGVQPLSETVPNVAIDLGVVAAGVGLWFWEDGRGKASLEALAEKKGTKNLLANLDVELFDGATSNMRGLEGKYRPVLLAGTAAEVTRSINLAGRVAADLKRNDMLLVPFFTDLEDDSAGWQAMKDSSTNGMWDSFLARPINREGWTEWLLAEKSQVAEKQKENKYNIDTKAFGVHPTPSDDVSFAP